MKITKLLLIFLISIYSFGQVSNGGETDFDYGIKNNAAQTVITPINIVTQGTDGTYGKALPANLPISYAVIDSLKLKSYLSTGLIKNGLVTTNADPTKFNITAGIGIISNFDDPENPTSSIINFPAFTGITPTYLTTGNITYVAINSVPAVVMQATPFTNIQRRDLIALGAVIHSNLTTINLVNNISAPTNAGLNQLHDLMEAIGALNISGNKYAGNGNLTINKSAGVIFKLGVNFANNWKDPNNLYIAPQSALTFRYRTQNGTEGLDVTNIDPSVYDLNNVLTAVPVNRFSIQTVTLFQTGQTRIQYGQTTYATMAEAEAAIITRAYVVEPNIAANGITRAYIILRHNATDLTNATTSKIIEAQKFGGVASGGVALTDSAIIAALGYAPENVANKQNSLAVDGTAMKYPTVDAVNSGLSLKSNDSDVVKLTGNQIITGTKTFTGQLQINSGTTPSLFMSSTDGSSATISNNAGDFTFKRFTSGAYRFKNTLDNDIFTLDLSGAGLFTNSVTSTGFIKSGATSTDALLAGGTTLASPETQINKSLGVLTDYLSDIKYPSVKAVYDWVTTEVVGAPLLGAIVPTDAPTGTGEAFWFATTAGTYTNFGGGVVGANEFAVFVRNSGGTFTMSKTSLDLSTYVQTANIVDNLLSTSTIYPLSANQGKILESKKANISDLEYASKISLGANIAGLLKTDGGSIDPFSDYRRTDFFEFTPGKKYTYSAFILAGGLFAGVCYYDDTYTFISYELQGGGSDRTETDFLLTIPPTAKYIKFGLTNASSGGGVQALNVKELNFVDVQFLYDSVTLLGGVNTSSYTCIGDSISYGVGSTGGATSWCDNLATRLGGPLTKLAVSGNSLWTHLRGQVEAVSPSSTFVTIMMGANDVTPINSATYTLGDISTVLSMVNDQPVNYASSTLYNDSFLGRFRWCLERAKVLNPTATFVVVTPVAWLDEAGAVQTTLEGIRKGQKIIAESLGIKALRITVNDVYQSPSFNLFLADSLHPNDKGYKQISNFVYSELFQ